VVAISGIGTGMQWRVLLAVPYAVAMLFVVRPLLRVLLKPHRGSETLTPGVLGIVLVGLLVSSYATEWMGIHFIFGAFLFGAIVPREGFGDLRAAVIDRIEPVNGMFLLPIFFVISGKQVDLSMLDTRAVVELILIITVAVAGKFLGAYAGARTQGVDSRTSATLATLMNTRGLTEIVFLTVGFGHGILDHGLYSLMVVMALVTTAMAGPLLHWIYPRHVAERDLAEASRYREPSMAV
jgi:Kef-type K+ transport system membrane component KefB